MPKAGRGKKATKVNTTKQAEKKVQPKASPRAKKTFRGNAPGGTWRSRSPTSSSTKKSEKNKAF